MDKMEAGELEIRKAFEDVTTNNVRATVNHSNTTRKLVTELNKKVGSLEGEIRQFSSKIDMLQSQITTLQTVLFAGGTA
jgi:chaperonin cofactor prefoldin